MYSAIFKAALVTKYNKNHDPKTGRFTFARNAPGSAKEGYVEEISPVGVNRRKNGKLYYTNGKPVPPKEAALFDRIPETRSTGPKRPRDMRLNEDRNAAMQVIFYRKNPRTGKMEQKYFYDQEKLGKKKAVKHARARSFNKAMGKFLDSVKKDLNNPNERTRQAAEINYLMFLTGMRVGNSRGQLGEKEAYGATTLQSRHLTISGKTARLKFPGKKGVPQDITVDDPLGVSILKRAKTRAKGARDQIFPRADEQASLAYVKTATGNPRFKNHDLRTWTATTNAIKFKKSMPRPKNQTQYKKYRMEVATKVGKILGNKPNEALDSYIDPTVWADWEDGLKP